ncbi:MAG: DUF6968 family protein [Polyangiaceae bacterium]
MSSKLDVIASRTLELRHRDGSSTPVVVRIGRPEPIDDGRNYRCEYEIEGLSTTKRAWLGGVDGAQALWMALVGVGIVLRTSEEGKEGRITFDGGEDLFFPNPDGVGQPEWHPFTVEGEEFLWRKYPSWQRTNEERAVRCWTLEVARTPTSIGVGTAYQGRDAVVGVEQAIALVRVCKEKGGPPL